MLVRHIRKKNLSEKKEYFIPGLSFFLLSMLFSLIGTEIPILNFLSGVFMGISVVFNVMALYYFGKALRKLKGDNSNISNTND